MKQEKIIQRGLNKIFAWQLAGLIDILESEVKSYEKKSSIEDRIKEYLENIKVKIPNYLFVALQPIMKRTYAQAVKPFKNFLNKPDYSLVFDVDNSPAVNFLRKQTEIHLSEKDGSISKTTRKEVLTLITQGIEWGKSYWEIAKDIRETAPFTFSKSRSELIAIQEVGQAYGYSNFEPARRMLQSWYKMEKRWSTVKDARVRATHLQNQEQGYIPLDIIFSWTWDMYWPSSDFRCRCVTSYKIVW